MTKPIDGSLPNFYGAIVYEYMSQHPNVYISILAIADFCNIGKTTLYKYRTQICALYGLEYQRAVGLRLRYSSQVVQLSASVAKAA